MGVLAGLEHGDQVVLGARDRARASRSFSSSYFLPVTCSSGDDLGAQLLNHVVAHLGREEPSPWYGTWSIAMGHLYSRLSSSNHFRNVKQPVYERSRRSGSGSFSPVGPKLPARSMPMSLFT
jgi:hypothetical protein